MDINVLSTPNSGFLIFSIFNLLIFLATIGFGVYVFILFIKLARRGIRALDIYIEKNKMTE